MKIVCTSDWLTILTDPLLRTAFHRAVLYSELKQRVIARSGRSAASVACSLLQLRIKNAGIREAFMDECARIEYTLHSGRVLQSHEHELRSYREYLTLPSWAATYFEQGRAKTAEAAFRLRHSEIERYLSDFAPSDALRMSPATAGHDTPNGTSPADISARPVVIVHQPDAQAVKRWLDAGGLQLVEAALRKRQQGLMERAFRSATETHRWRPIE